MRMFKKFLFWLTRFCFGEVQIWIRPIVEKSGSGGRIVFLNAPLTFPDEEEFMGLANLQKLAARLEKPISIWTSNEDDRALIGYILPTSTPEELDRFAEEIKEKCPGLLVTFGDPTNSYWETVPRIYV